MAVQYYSQVDTTRIQILVMDRDPASARAICNFLKPAGYQLSLACNEIEAVALAG
jgi:CheY-like chemotaxis protein